MSKRPSIDLAALTSEAAAPMAEASQRTARVVPIAAPQAPAPASAPVAAKPKPASTPTANLQALAFKVPPAFRKRFRQRAANADLKLNELLFEALDAWEEKQGLKK
jgi:hypothetical protein